MKFKKLDFEDLDWDLWNIVKVTNRISRADLEIFFNQELFVQKDLKHSTNKEERFIAMGELNNRVLFVCYTIRFKSNIPFLRIISARYVHSKEKEFYEKAKKS